MVKDVRLQDHANLTVIQEDAIADETGTQKTLLRVTDKYVGKKETMITSTPRENEPSSPSESSYMEILSNINKEFYGKKMAQAQIISRNVNEMNKDDITVHEQNNKRKVGLYLENNQHVSIFKDNQGHTVINVRTGTRSVSLSKDTFLEICDLKEVILLCCSFVDGGA
ncbi:hypothetical protein ACF0H5_000077 [Mactra antiquata]